MSYITVIEWDWTNNCYAAYHPELPTCISQGETSKEAEQNLIEATELTIAHLETNNLSIPKPMSLENFTYYGRSIT